MKMALTTLARNIHIVLPYHERLHSIESHKYLANSLTGSQGRRKPASAALFDLNQDESRGLELPRGK